MSEDRGTCVSLSGHNFRVWMIRTAHPDIHDLWYNEFFCLTAGGYRHLMVGTLDEARREAEIIRDSEKKEARRNGV